MSLLRVHYHLAKDSLRHHRSRSLLSCLGIAIGVASIILILSLTGSIASLVETHLGNLGSDLIIIRPSSNENTTTAILSELTNLTSYKQSNLSLANLETISKTDNVLAAAPIAKLTATVTTSEDRAIDSATILGTNSDFLAIESRPMGSGIFLDEAKTATAAVIGHTSALHLFGNGNPVGKSIHFLGQNFIIVGVLAEVADPINVNGVDLDNTIIVQASSLTGLDSGLQIQQFNVRVQNTDSIAETAAKLESALKAHNSGDNNFSVAYGDAITHPSNSLLVIVSGILTLVASISLIVGGIGVMNIMLVSVSERSHEIGIRKAVGASSFNIFSQFLFESLILCFAGGILGFAIAYGAAFFICLITPFNPFISWEVLATTFATSVLAGTLFGLYPAMKAAHKSPADTLKSCYN